MGDGKSAVRRPRCHGRMTGEQKCDRMTRLLRVEDMESVSLDLGGTAGTPYLTRGDRHQGCSSRYNRKSTLS